MSSRSNCPRRGNVQPLNQRHLSASSESSKNPTRDPPARARLRLIERPYSWPAGRSPMRRAPESLEKGTETMNENQKSNAALPTEWDREWSRVGVPPSADDLNAFYDRGGIVLKTKFVDGDRLGHIGFCYSDGLIGYLEEIQQAGAKFDAKAYLEGITGDIARAGLERGRALLRLVAYALSQPPNLTENIWKHVGVKDQKFVIDDNGRGALPDEVFDLALQIMAPEKSEAAPATGDEPAEAEQRDKEAPLFVEDAGGLRLVDRWWVDRALAYQNGTLKSAVKLVFPETVEELEILNAERAKDGLPPTSLEVLRAYDEKIARQFGWMPQLH